ncbi:hypothetical protein [Sediminicola sp. 1XM1-17]|uniref:hypothetical protein n=1 Tax=Sediminicola sp. 1XM1-17 TaxID=3127702 RepID=UPI0030774522
MKSPFLLLVLLLITLTTHAQIGKSQQDIVLKFGEPTRISPPMDGGGVMINMGSSIYYYYEDGENSFHFDYDTNLCISYSVWHYYLTDFYKRVKYIKENASYLGYSILKAGSMEKKTDYYQFEKTGYYISVFLMPSMKKGNVRYFENKSSLPDLKYRNSPLY